ncbi:hypothetical protein [Rhodococcus sp. ZPP]
MGLLALGLPEEYWAIAGGTPAVQRTRIASEFLGRRFDQRA